jgi:hypothetical protein
MYKGIFYWLLNKGILRAALILNSILYSVLSVELWILNWLVNHWR